VAFKRLPKNRFTTPARGFMGEIYKAAVGAFQSHREPFAGGIDRDAAEPAGVGRLQALPVHIIAQTHSRVSRTFFRINFGCDYAGFKSWLPGATATNMAYTF
jgi:hypothetical protein